MTTEVRDNTRGQKNSPRGPSGQKGNEVDGRKKGTLEHGHGNNESTADSLPNRKKRDEQKHAGREA